MSPDELNLALQYLQQVRYTDVYGKCYLRGDGNKQGSPSDLATRKTLVALEKLKLHLVQLKYKL